MTPNQEPVERWKEEVIGDDGSTAGDYFTPHELAFISHQKSLSRAEVLEEIRDFIERRKQPDVRCGYCGECRLLPETGMCWRFINNQLLSDTLAVVDELEGNK